MANLRQEMPLCAAFIDQMREAFGEGINEAMRNAIKHGSCDFYAEENGIKIGHKAPETDRAICVRDMVIAPKKAEGGKNGRP